MRIIRRFSASAIACAFVLYVVLWCASGCSKSAAPATEKAKEATPKPPSEVKVGWLLPLSGASASIGLQMRTGAEIAADEINAKGGISSLGGAKLKLVFADSKTHADTGVAETERLITRENVVMLAGAYNSAVTFPASEVAERYKVPWVSQGAVKDEITERGFKYVFRINNKAIYDTKEMFEAIELFQKETGKGPKSVGLLYEGTDWGRSAAKSIKQFADERKMNVVVDEAYPPGTADLTAQVLKVKGAGPEVLFIAMYTPEHILFNKAYMQHKVDIPYGVWSVGSGSEDPAFYKAVDPKSVEYMFVQEDWDLAGPQKYSWLKEVSDKFKAKLGYDLTAQGSQGYAAMWVIKDVLERAASVDREKIREALAKTDITAGPALASGYQRIKFDEQGQNTFAHGVISQNLKGTRTPLWPVENRPSGAKPVWPVPSWRERGS